MQDKNNYSFPDKSISDVMLEAYVMLRILRSQDKTPYDYQFMETNQQFEALTNLSRVEVVGRTIKEVFNKFPELWQNLHNALLKERNVVRFEFILEVNNRYFRVSATYPSDEIIILLFIEITTQKKAEETLAVHEILFDNAHDIILYVNLDDEIVDSNQRALEKYGYTKQEILDKKITDIRHSSTSLDYDEQMYHANYDGIIFESLHVRKDGTTLPVEVSAKSTIVGKEPLRIHIIRDITERKEQEKQIVWLARHDSLTGVPNRNSFIMQLEQEIRRSSRNKTKFAVMLFDIDKFKYINDQYGHEAGDKVLCHVARKVQGVIRSTDYISRLGGDEFVGLLTDIKKKEDMIFLAEKIQKAANEPLIYNASTLEVKISIGMSFFPDDATDADELLFYADKAMYEIKNKGGGSYSFYSR